MPLREDLEQRIAAVLATRVDRILLVLEAVTDNKNYLAALRTCDVLGVQRVAVITAQSKAAAAEDGGEGAGDTCIEQVRQQC
jgi:tRNA G18 (ribose-2'-O)-methylase SpoU